MDVNREKQKVFSKIAAVKIDADSLIQSKNNLFPSVSQGGDVTNFLLDLLKTLEDVNQMKDIIIDTIHRNSEEFEVKIKNTLKKSLNNIVLCFSDPTVPSNYLMSSAGVGFETNVNNIDLTKLLKTNPTSEVGKLLYFDNNTGLASSDLNVVLYTVISQPNTWVNWKNIIHIKFNTQQTIQIKIHNSYAGKKLSKFFWDLIEAIDLFDTRTLLNNLVDTYSGTIKFKLKKTKEQIHNEAVIDKIIENILKDDEDEEKEASGYFTFTNEDNIEIEDIVNARNNGTFVVDMAYDSLEQMIGFESLDSVDQQLSNSNASDIEDIIQNALDSLGSIDSFEIGLPDIQILNLNFIETIVKNLSKLFTNAILSPKIILPFLLANHMVNGTVSATSNDFIKNNLNIFKDIVKSIKNMVVGLILDRCIKLLTEIVLRKMSSIMKEKITNRKKQINSLIGL